MAQHAQPRVGAISIHHGRAATRLGARREDAVLENELLPCESCASAGGAALWKMMSRADSEPQAETAWRVSSPRHVTTLASRAQVGSVATQR